MARKQYTWHTDTGATRRALAARIVRAGGYIIDQGPVGNRDHIVRFSATEKVAKELAASLGKTLDGGSSFDEEAEG